jgi:hypothetical protein
MEPGECPNVGISEPSNKHYFPVKDRQYIRLSMELICLMTFGEISFKA